MFDVAEDRKKMEAVIERFKNEMKKVRTGRAHPDMLSGVKVEVYGQFMPLNQVANITAADATLLVITPFDPTNIQAIAAAIRADQSLGLNPADDGRVIRVPIPALTEERRKEIVKNADKMRKKVKTSNEKDIDEITKEFTEKVETEYKAKSEEIMKL